MVNEGEIGVERQLPGNISASATYMLTRGQHLPVCGDVNLAPPTGTISYDALAGSFFGGVSVPASTVTVPLFTARANSNVGIISACQSIVHSLYNAAVFTVKKQFSHDFELLANYTVSKTEDDGQVLGDTGTFNGSSDAPLNPFNQQAEWGASDYDQRQRFVASFLYSPTHHTENPILNYAINGFGFGGIVTIGSPFPVNGLMNSTSNPALTALGISNIVDAGVTGGVESNASDNAGRNPVFPKNYFRGPTQIRDVDFRITRDFRLWKERYKLQIIGEAFNLFNHTNITTVNTTAYAYLAAGSGACPPASATNAACLVPQSSFMSPTATSDNLLTARQLQISGKFFF